MNTPTANNDQATPLILALSAAVGLGMAFQVGHFAEHAVQFSVWLTGKYQWVLENFCGRDTPFMSGPVTGLVQYIGALCAPEGAAAARKGMLGVEVLHLIGNSIFLATIFGAHYLWRSKWTRWALYIEGFHLCEHIALTLTAIYIGKPIGLSTAFGQSALWWGKEAAVGYRVSWHFAMNLLPMPFVMIGMMEHWPEMMRSMFPRFEPRKLIGAMTAGAAKIALRGPQHEERPASRARLPTALDDDMIEWFLAVWVLVGLLTVAYVCRREGHGPLRWVASVFIMSWLGPVLTLLVWRTYRHAR